jgi:hypothetical protein
MKGTGDAKQPRHPKVAGAGLLGGTQSARPLLPYWNEQRPCTRHDIPLDWAAGAHAFNGETGISRYAAVLLRQEEGAVHPPHGAPVPDRGTGSGGIGLLNLRAGGHARGVARGARQTRATFLAYGDTKRPATKTPRR